MMAAGNRFKKYCMTGINGTQQTTKSINGMSFCLQWEVEGFTKVE